ncbi:MAG: acetyl-CoA carboxylase biotin carboxylase subunit family protein [Candidatus Babeliales bacterium]
MKKKILVLNGIQRDRRELSRPQFKQYDIIFEETSLSWLSTLCNVTQSQEVIAQKTQEALDVIVAKYANGAIDGLVSTDDYPANVMSAVLREKLKIYGTSLLSILLCEHKYYARIYQMQVLKDIVPYYSLVKNNTVIDNTIPLPFIIKPVKSTFSAGTHIIRATHEIAEKISQASKVHFLGVFNYFLKQYELFEYDACNSIAEEFLQGYQTTVEGFIYNNEVTILGIVDSHFYPQTISFMRFEYPSSLQPDVQQRMGEDVARVIKHMGLNNTLFNVECMYSPVTGAIKIIEINPRISSQFADLFERVDGFNTYEIMIELSLGQRPIIKKRAGAFKIAASFVLRLFEDHIITKLPSEGSIKQLQTIFPDMHVEIFGDVGQKLSEDHKKDGHSFRYALINLGAYDQLDLMNRYDICKKLLDFRFEPVL